ncbi:unnamed protein product [Rhizoctonia solani]|uniref:Uncharacterized protein n=1 Tax=Rhizoctonia solani TaxID=456999 RepID=A0A8H2WFW4_9AGAM|nr:unnamed protein product [Rhizoctonia solani]
MNSGLWPYHLIATKTCPVFGFSSERRSRRSTAGFMVVLKLQPMLPAPSDLGEAPSCRPTISDSWYMCSNPAPTKARPEGLPDYDELLYMVQGNSSSQDVVANQQQEIIQYLGGIGEVGECERSEYETTSKKVKALLL